MPARRFRSALCMLLVIAFTVLGAAGHAAAQSEAMPSEQQAEQDKAMALMDEEARQHFQIGKSLYDAGRFNEAASEFEHAYQKSGRPQLLYNLYVANRDASNWAAAVEALRGYLDKVPDAADRINLRARLKSMEEAAARDAEQKRQVEAEAERKRQAALVPKTRTEVVHSIVPWVLVGVGGALAAGGVVTAVLANSKVAELEDKCSGKVCSPAESDTVDSAKMLALTTDMLIGAGIVTAGVGIVLYFTGAFDKERQVPIANLSCTDHGCAATWTGRF